MLLYKSGNQPGAHQLAKTGQTILKICKRTGLVCLSESVKNIRIFDSIRIFYDMKDANIWSRSSWENQGEVILKIFREKLSSVHWSLISSFQSASICQRSGGQGWHIWKCIKEEFVVEIYLVFADEFHKRPVKEKLRRVWSDWHIWKCIKEEIMKRPFWNSFSFFWWTS